LHRHLQFLGRGGRIRDERFGMASSDNRPYSGRSLQRSSSKAVLGDAAAAA